MADQSLLEEIDRIYSRQNEKKYYGNPVHYVIKAGTVQAANDIISLLVFALKANVRRGGVMYLIVGGIVTGFVVYFLSQIIYALGINNYIPILIAVWTPILIIVMIATSILLHLEGN